MVVSPPSAIKQALRFPDLVATPAELRQPAIGRKKLLSYYGQGTSISLQRLLGARDPKRVEPCGDLIVLAAESGHAHHGVEARDRLVGRQQRPQPRDVAERP